MERNTRLTLIGCIFAALAAGFVLGSVADEGTFGTSLQDATTLVREYAGQPADVDFTLFWNAWDALHERFVDSEKLNTQDLIYGAVAGMIQAAGDQYTVFFEPVTNKKFRDEISGTFSGVGIEIGKRNDLLTVISPIKNTPAFRAGIRTGDIILAIDKKTTADMTVEEAVTLIRGPRGSTVTLSIRRNGNSDTEIPIVRENIRIPAVEWSLLNADTAYLELSTFNQNVDDEFRKAAREIQKTSAKNIILDLRSNPGGLLDSSVYIAGWFLDPGSTVTIERFGDGSENVFRTTGEPELRDYNVIILTNGGSASASEILAGALHDVRSIRIVGEKTFGKGSVQEVIEFPGGSALKVTVARWLTPNGISISEKGIEPDVKVTLPEEAITSGAVEFGTPGKDPQLDKALELLR